MRNLLWTAIFALTVLAAVRAQEPTETFTSVADLQRALRLARPGSEYVLASGTYRQVSLFVDRSGKPEAPITIRAEEGGSVTFTEACTIDISASYVIFEGFRFADIPHPNILNLTAADRCRISHCAFINTGQGVKKHIVQFRAGANHNIFEFNYMEGNRSIGVSILVRPDQKGEGTVHNIIRRNYFRDIDRLSNNGQEPVQIGQQVYLDWQYAYSHTIVEENLFINCNGDREIVSSKSSGNLIRHNTIQDSWRGGIVLRAGNAARVEGNYLINTDVGIRAYGDGNVIVNNYIVDAKNGAILFPGGDYDAGEPSTRGYQRTLHSLIAHNTIVGGQGGAIVFGGLERPPQGLRVCNNLFINPSDPPFPYLQTAETTWQSNLLATNDETAQWQVPPSGIEIVPAPPPFESAVQRLRPDIADAVDTGLPLREAIRDIDGDPRDTRPDIGADERPTPRPRIPLAPSDVGPRWMRM